MAENETIQSQDEELADLSHVDEYLKIGQDYDCSDIHLATNAMPTWRRYGTLQPIWENAKVLTAEDTEKLLALNPPPPNSEMKSDSFFQNVPLPNSLP